MNITILTNVNVFGLDIQIITLFLTALSTIAWFVYVYYTIKTFNEIKKQTDLQSRSYLVINTKEDKFEFHKMEIPQEAIAIHEKWSGIISNNYSRAMREEQVLILILQNRGKSDIIKWRLKVRGRILAGEYLKNKVNINDDSFEYQLKSKTNLKIKPNEDKKIALLPIGLFPHLELEWEIYYSDILTDKTYELKSNGYEYKNSNLIVYEAK